jgi:pyridoxamine 5'-phosphate oxidase
MSIWDTRTDYGKHALEENNLPSNPADLAQQWIQSALAAELPEPNAMALSTIDAEGFPATRIVLLREQIGDSYRFFTNYNSHKGEELAKNTKASLLFFWSTLERQIRVTGHCEKIPAADSDKYFASRPRDSQLGAWASPQSEIIASRTQLDEHIEMLRRQYPNEVPRPPHWGGYALTALKYEFWQGQKSRLHDRVIYTQTKDSAATSQLVWLTNRLAP